MDANWTKSSKFTNLRINSTQIVFLFIKDQIIKVFLVKSRSRLTMISFKHTLLLTVLSVTQILGSGVGPFQVHNITRFDDIKFENLAVRSNGQILVTISAPLANLYLVDPLKIRPPVLIHAFPTLEHLTGIYESERDVFYVAGGNWTITPPSLRVPASLSVFRVDMT